MLYEAITREGNRKRSNETTSGREGKARQGKAKKGKRRRKQSRERELVSTLKNLKEQSAFKFILAIST